MICELHIKTSRFSLYFSSSDLNNSWNWFQCVFIQTCNEIKNEDSLPRACCVCVQILDFGPKSFF